MAVDVLARAKPSMKQNAPEAEITPVLGTGTEVAPRVNTIPEQPVIQEAPESGYEAAAVETPAPISGVMGRSTPPSGNYYAETAPLVSSWESTAKEISESQFKVDLNKAKQTMLRSAQQVQSEGQQSQTELALGEYMRGQSAEKAGWTGGYMLDQKRQGDYLKASIQAQMYGAQELQKFGMDTQLEAARLSYDLGKQNLAYKLYQDAQQMAVTEAQMFGYYVSPEIRDLLNQRTAAQSVLSDMGSTEEDKNRAQKILDQVDVWFGEQNLDPNDITKFGQITMEREAQNQAKLDAVLASIGDDPSMFIARNNDGTYMIDPATQQYVKMNFADVTKEDLYNFLNKDDNSELKFADSAFKSYARFLSQSSIASYMATLNEDEEPTQAGFAKFIAEEGNDKLAAYFESVGLTTEEAQAIIGDTFTASLTSDGKTISYGYGGTTGDGTSTTPPTTPTEEVVVDENNPDGVYTDFTIPYNDIVVTKEDFIERYRKYAEFTNVGGGLELPTSAAEYADQYKVFYDNAIKNHSFSNQIPESVNYKDWAKNLHNSHNMFIGGSYEKHIEERIGSYFKEKAGFDFGEIKFEDTPSGPNASTIKIDAFNLTKVQKQKLIELGFNSQVVNGKETLYIGFRKPESIKPLPGSQKVTNWNGTYGGWNNSRQDKEYWLFTLLKQPSSNLTNTTEGEGRF